MPSDIGDPELRKEIRNGRKENKKKDNNIPENLSLAHVHNLQVRAIATHGMYESTFVLFSFFFHCKLFSLTNYRIIV